MQKRPSIYHVQRKNGQSVPDPKEVRFRPSDPISVQPLRLISIPLSVA